jgi:hypothetical protein
MIRHELARILRALADRLEVQKLTPEVKTESQYVYVYNVPPVTVVPTTPGLPWQSPYYHSTSGAVN